MEETDTAQTQTIASIAKEENTVTVEIPETYPLIKDFSEFKSVSESQEYNFDTDAHYQDGPGGSTVTKITESDKYIYIYNGDKSNIMTIDKTSYRENVFCTKPECSHKYISIQI